MSFWQSPDPYNTRRCSLSLCVCVCVHVCICECVAFADFSVREFWKFSHVQTSISQHNWGIIKENLYSLMEISAGSWPLSVPNTENSSSEVIIVDNQLSYIYTAAGSPKLWFPSPPMNTENTSACQFLFNEEILNGLIGTGSTFHITIFPCGVEVRFDMQKFIMIVTPTT